MLEAFDIKEVNRLIQNRRSIYPKMFSGDPIPDHVIEEMLENANWAPTHKLTEPWRFVVFSGDGLKKVGEYSAAAAAAAKGKEPDKKSAKKYAEKPMMCSHVIAIGMKRDKSLPKMEEVAAVSMAVQNMWLTATANGVGCYWSTGGVTFVDGAQEAFGWGKKDKLLGFLYCGMPKKKWPKGKRKPIDKKVKWVKE